MGNSNKLTLAALLALHAAAWGASPPDPMALLKQAMREPAVPYWGQISVTRWFGKQTRAEEVNVFYDPSNRYRWEFLSPDGSVHRIVVSDGAREELRLVRERKTLQGDALKTSDKLMSPERESELLVKNYRVSFQGQDSVTGRPTWIIELRPLVEGKARQRLWIDKETGVILENKRYQLDRPFAALSRFTRFEPQKSLSQDLFRLSADSEAGVDSHGLDPGFLSIDQLDQAMGRHHDFPAELMGGFVFESADFFDVGKEVVRHVRYTDGLSVVSLFQTDRPVRLNGSGTSEPSLAGWPPGSLHLSSSGKVLSWKQGRHFYTLVGDVSKELLGRIAAKIRKPA